MAGASQLTVRVWSVPVTAVIVGASGTVITVMWKVRLAVAPSLAVHMYLVRALAAVGVPDSLTPFRLTPFGRLRFGDVPTSVYPGLQFSPLANGRVTSTAVTVVHVWSGIVTPWKVRLVHDSSDSTTVML